MTFDREQTIRDTVVEDFRTAAVFQKYGLDFCCGGGVSIEAACRKKGIDVDVLAADLARSGEFGGVDLPRFSSWSPDFLADYIEKNHHAWVRSAIPVLKQHAAKVAKVHGGFRETLVEIDQKVQSMADELMVHMEREEKELFPLIRSYALGNPETRSEDLLKIVSIIEEMESDHDDAGDVLREIRELADDFVPPPEACMTYKVLFSELEEFERDLHTHVHLENNLLFPRFVPEAVEAVN